VLQYLTLPGLVTGLLVLTLPRIVIAADDTPLDEIVVTADFRERPSGQLPVSVTVLNGDFIGEAAVQHFEELINVIPNLNWSGDGHRPRYFQIRGVGELEQYQGAPNPSIGFIIDDIDFSGIGTVATIFDIESVEVLRGSQGSRYGANALGGLIYVRSRAPTPAFDGRIEATVGGDDAFSLGAAAGGPLNDRKTLLVRVSAQQYRSDGFRHNSYLDRDDTNRRDESSARVRLSWQATETLVLDLAALYGNIEDGYDAFALDNGYQTLSDHPGIDAQESTGASLRLEWDGLGRATLTSITAVASSDIDVNFDADWGNPDSWAPVTYDYVSLNHRDRTTLSQELRLASNDDGRIFSGTAAWLVGLYWQRMDEELLTVNLGEYYDPFYDFADSLADALGSEYAANNVALFGQLDIELSDSTRLGAGLRIEKRKTDYVDTTSLRAAPEETMWGGELSLTHDHNGDLTSFVTLSKGYKAGGFNLGMVPPEDREFGEENLWTLEAGIKSFLRDNSLMFNASLFASRRIDQQVRTSTQLIPGDPASFVFYTDNAARGESVGLEAESRWYATDAWEFYASIGLLRATFDEFVTPAADLGGRDQAHAPHYTLAAGAIWRRPDGLFARLDVTAIDRYYFDVSHDQQSNPYQLLNASVGYQAESWSVQVWGRNLLDEKYAVRGFYFGNEPPDFPDTLYVRLGDPRQVGVTFEKGF